MKIESSNTFSYIKASKNFPEVAETADKKGYAVIIRNSTLHYALVPFDKAESLLEQLTSINP